MARIAAPSGAHSIDARDRTGQRLRATSMQQSVNSTTGVVVLERPDFHLYYTLIRR